MDHVKAGIMATIFQFKCLSPILSIFVKYNQRILNHGHGKTLHSPYWSNRAWWRQSHRQPQVWEKQFSTGKKSFSDLWTFNRSMFFIGFFWILILPVKIWSVNMVKIGKTLGPIAALSICDKLWLRILAGDWKCETPCHTNKKTSGSSPSVTITSVSHD